MKLHRHNRLAARTRRQFATPKKTVANTTKPAEVAAPVNRKLAAQTTGFVQSQVNMLISELKILEAWKLKERANKLGYKVELPEFDLDKALESFGAIKSKEDLTSFVMLALFRTNDLVNLGNYHPRASLVNAWFDFDQAMDMERTISRKLGILNKGQEPFELSLKDGFDSSCAESIVNSIIKLFPKYLKFKV